MPEPHSVKTILEDPTASGSGIGTKPQLGKELPVGQSWYSPAALWDRKTTVIAVLSIVAILSSLVLRFGFHTTPGRYQLPLLATLVIGGLPLLYDLLGSS